MIADSDQEITLRVINGLYVEAMVLADEARAYFDDACRDTRALMPPLTRVTFSCESLKVTTRLMHVIAWLLSQKAVFRGEGSATEPAYLGKAAVSDANTVSDLPLEAQRIILATNELYRRIGRLDVNMHRAELYSSPALSLQSKLLYSF
jgi:regulator of CtrA degradation